MGSTVLTMSMSVDGFITGPDDDAEHGLGVDGEVLHDWLGPFDGGPRGFDPPGVSGEVLGELMATGSVLVGRRTFDLAGQWNGDHHGVPIFVPTRGTPPAEPISDWVTYVTDGVERATALAKEAAGDRDVLVHGADLAQSMLRAGVLDELQLHLVPILLGAGRRLFDHLGTDHTQLEIVRVLAADDVTHLRYRVRA